jgi:D-aspartate ligase
MATTTSRSPDAAKLGRPPAIVLCKVTTGLASVRSLAAAGIDVHAFVFNLKDPLRRSRHGTKVDVHRLADDDAALIEFLCDYARRLGGRPVVLPTSDRHALLLAQHRERLEPVCRVSTTQHAQLRAIVCKDGLYRTAEDAGVSTVPGISHPTAPQIDAWSQQHPGPYLLKPLYEEVPGSPLKAKNRVIADRDALLDFVHTHGAEGLVVQRLLRGGDGEIYDAYGLCDREGAIVTLASHRRLRQYPPNLGTTSYGEIPAGLPGGDEVLFEPTRRLVAAVRYHGIFGIEWLRDRSTGALHLIDFNARPFTSIGHLRDCGLDLPLLAYRELVGEDLAGVDPQPVLRHRLWVDFVPDAMTQREAAGGHGRSFAAWSLSVLVADSYAYWAWSDPGPGLQKLAGMLGTGLRYCARRWLPKPLVNLLRRWRDRRAP